MTLANYIGRKNGATPPNGAGTDPLPQFLSDGRPMRAADLDFSPHLADAAPPEPRKLTDLEQVARWIVSLFYADMKQMAGELVGEKAPANATEMADALHEWAKKKLERAS